MQFIVKRDILLKSLSFVQGVVEKKNTLPILSNVLLQLKDNKLSIVATDLDIVFYDEINEVKILNRDINKLLRFRIDAECDRAFDEDKTENTRKQ